LSVSRRLPDLMEVERMEKRRQEGLADPYEYGFGPRVMKEIKVCSNCGKIEEAGRYTCSECGKRLPAMTIFQNYQKKHKTCALCDTVLASYMRYCPHCGMKIEEM